MTKMEYKKGSEAWYHDENSGRIIGGKILSTTSKFCIIEHDNGTTKRKSKHLTFSTKDLATLRIVLNIKVTLEEQFKVSISESFAMFERMLDKYPESFV
jgi:predicted Ser/Thr protein kinase